MGNIVFLCIMGPVAGIFTGLGIWVWRKKEPGNFWTGQEFKPGEIRDIKKYNRSLGMLWIGFSVLVWITTIVGTIFGGKIGGLCMLGCFAVGIPMLPVIYNMIYKKYYDPQKAG